MAWKFNKRDIIIASEPAEDNELVLNLTSVQLKESYQDSIQILDQVFKENNIAAAVMIPDLFGLLILLDLRSYQWFIFVKMRNWNLYS